MFRDKRILYSLTAGLLLILLILFFIPVASSRIAAAILLVPAAVAFFVLIKKRAIYSTNRWQVLLITVFTAIVYISLYYTTGLSFGFTKPIHRFNLVNFGRYILPISAIIISAEIIRGVVLAQGSKLASVITYFACVVSEVLTASNFYGVKNFNQFMDLVGITFFPAIIANLVYHYIAKRYGIIPNLAYRLMIALFPYVIPLASAVPDSLYSFARLIIPTFIYSFVDALFEKRRRYALRKPSRFYYAGIALMAAVMISIVMLISCQFKYGLVVVATESMTGEINKGDAIIYEEFDGQTIEEGQVIVFRKDNRLVIHRVIDIQRINGITRYYTKGDANDSPDDGYVIKSQIVGLTDIKISYIGYPTVWIREIFSKGNAG